MAITDWSRDFETGIDSVDKQHKVLFLLINQLGATFTTGSGMPKVDELLKQLRSYTVFHFNDEECLMLASDIPHEEQEKHKAEHQQFIQKLNTIKQRTGELSIDSANDIFDFLSNWLIFHILGSDMEIMRRIQLYEARERIKG